MKKQILVIHGGDSYDKYESYIEFLKSYDLTMDEFRKVGWKSNLQKDLGEDFEVIRPQMPCAWNAKYSEWKIWFEKTLKLLDKKIIIVGHSLGGMFIAKYLSENIILNKIEAAFLVAACFDNKDADYEMGDFILPKSLSEFEKQAENIFLFHSKDDSIVPFVDLDKYSKALPKAQKIAFKNRDHFHKQDHFPELVDKIKEISK